MPLYIHSLAYFTYVLPDLLKIVGGDMGIGEPTYQPITGYVLITYKPSGNQVGQVLLDRIVNQSPANDIFVEGVESTRVTPCGDSVSDHAGITYAPWINGSASGILIYYDVEDCGGQNYWLCGTICGYFPSVK